MTRVLLLGAAGRMGCAVQSAAQAMPDITIVAGVDRAPLKGSAFPVFHELSACGIPADVLVEFSSPQAVAAALPICTERGLPCVLCTTGLSEEQLSRVKEVSEKTAVLKSANMSLGINLLQNLLKKAAVVLAEAGFDIEIVEKHHNRKLDAPSGTAIALADSINEEFDNAYHYVYDRSTRRQKRDEKEIGISAVRGGTIVGDHDVIFAGEDEVITFSHRAYSRNVFAKGALQAAKFLKGQPAGLYDMSDVIGG